MHAWDDARHIEQLWPCSASFVRLAYGCYYCASGLVGGPHTGLVTPLAALRSGSPWPSMLERETRYTQTQHDMYRANSQTRTQSSVYVHQLIFTSVVEGVSVSCPLERIARLVDRQIALAQEKERVAVPKKALRILPLVVSSSTSYLPGYKSGGTCVRGPGVQACISGSGHVDLCCIAALLGQTLPRPDSKT